MREGEGDDKAEDVMNSIKNWIQRNLSRRGFIYACNTPTGRSGM
jgi:hypothetical protein